MFPPLPTEQAHRYCEEILSLLTNKSLILDRVSFPSPERDGHGVMIGVLVCSDADGREVVLNAVSGNSLVPVGLTTGVWVPPIVTSVQIAAALVPNDVRIHELTAALKTAVSSTEKRHISDRRAVLTGESLAAVHRLYRFHTIAGGILPLSEICRKRLPPTGTGDCCAPKLLDYAFSHGLHPVSMDEVYYGKKSANRINGMSYPPCDERCGIILPVMLGLEIIYRDDAIVVVNKQPGLLSVPGRGPDKQDCVVTRLRRLFPSCIIQPSVHRLDMETSGLLVLALTTDAQRDLSIQFQTGQVQKKYTALLDGNIEHAPGASAPVPGQMTGKMTLWFRLDIENRPHQIWDRENGKESVTEWARAGFRWYRGADGKNRKVTRIIFIPHTGRTHQLRLASADGHGFGIPIVGDTLYGTCDPDGRLMLHAHYLSFMHPVTGKRLEFTNEVPF